MGQRTLASERIATGVTGGSAAGNNAVRVRPDLLGNAREFTVYAHFKAGTGAGVFTVETSHDPDFTGTWASLGTLTWAAADGVKHLSVAGAYKAVRIRESTNVTGGVADLYVHAN